jgi:Cu+-exporting ATPase
MIKAKKIVVLLVVAIAVYSCSNNSEPIGKTGIEVSTEKLAVVDYAIEGMVCAMGCAATIEKDVASIAGVLNANVDYASGKAHFEFDETVISESEIIDKIENIADGQYKVGQWDDVEDFEKEVETEEVEVSRQSESSISSVSLPTFIIPNLFTLLLDQI